MLNVVLLGLALGFINWLLAIIVSLIWLLVHVNKDKKKQQETNEMNQIVQKMEDEIARQRKELQETRLKADEAFRNVAKKEKLLEGRFATSNQLEKKILAQEARLAGLDSGISERSDRIKSQKLELEKQYKERLDLEQLNAVTQALTQQINTKQGTFQTLERDLAFSQNKLEETKSQHETLSEKVAELETKLVKCSKAMAETDLQLLEKKKELTELEEGLHQLNGQRTDLLADVEALELEKQDNEVAEIEENMEADLSGEVTNEPLLDEDVLSLEEIIDPFAVNHEPTKENNVPNDVIRFGSFKKKSKKERRTREWAQQPMEKPTTPSPLKPPIEALESVASKTVFFRKEELQIPEFLFETELTSIPCPHSQQLIESIVNDKNVRTLGDLPSSLGIFLITIPNLAEAQLPALFDSLKSFVRETVLLSAVEALFAKHPEEGFCQVQAIFELPVVRSNFFESRALLNQTIQGMPDYRIIGPEHNILVKSDSKIKSEVDFVTHILITHHGRGALMRDFRRSLMDVNYSKLGALSDETYRLAEEGEVPFEFVDGEIHLVEEVEVSQNSQAELLIKLKTTADSEIEFLKRNGLEYVDVRHKPEGSLWVIADANRLDLMERGYRYSMKGARALNGKSGWWKK